MKKFLSLKAPRISRTRLYLVLALLLAAAALFGTRQLLMAKVKSIQDGAPVKTVMVLAPTRDLPKGTALSDADVMPRSVSLDSTHEASLRPEQFDAEFRGRKLAFAVRAGEPLLTQFFEAPGPAKVSDVLQVGSRAITIPVDENSSFAGMLQPGHRIDLMLTVKRDAKTYLKPLLLDVLVMATGSSVSEVAGSKEMRRFTTVTLTVSPVDAERILAAREVGKLTALLRAPGDHGEVDAKRKEALVLVDMEEPRPAALPAPQPVQPGVRVIYGIPGAHAPANGLMADLAALRSQLAASAKAPE